MTKQEFQKSFTELTDIPENKFHPLVWIWGKPEGLGDEIEKRDIMRTKIQGRGN